MRSVCSSNYLVCLVCGVSYWVNYDVDVPLFLPLYADRRLYDMRKIAVEVVQQNFKLTVRHQ